MSRVTIDLDDETLRKAAEILGTRTKVETVNAALADVVRRRGQIEFLDTFDRLDLDLGNEEVMRGAWR